MTGTNFGGKLALTLKALTLSNGRVAADVGVDKSVVGRWLSGVMVPSAHNLARLTDYLARRLPGLSLLDWDRDDADFRRMVDQAAGVPAVPELPAAVAQWARLGKMIEADTATRAEAGALAGIWRSTRPSPELPGRFVHDHVLIERRDDGSLRYRAGALWARFDGWALVSGRHLYACCIGDTLGTFVFTVLNLAPGARVEAMDGVIAACMADAGGTPVAMAVYLERVADLTGDAAADETAYSAMLGRHPVIEPDRLPADLVRRLLPDTGPKALADGGDPVIQMCALTSLARSGTAPAADHG